MHSTLLKTGINYRGNRDRKNYLCINGCFKDAKKKKKRSQVVKFWVKLLLLNHQKVWVTLTVIVNLTKYC